MLTLGCRLQFAKCSLGHGLLSDRGVSCKATFVVLFEQFALLFLQHVQPESHSGCTCFTFLRSRFAFLLSFLRWCLCI